MTEVNTIGITGEDGAGKSTVAMIIQEVLEPSRGEIYRMAFADDLKLMLLQLDPILGPRTIGRQAEGIRLSELIEEGYTEADIKAAYPEYRRLLRTLGTKCLRSRDPYFWIGSLSEAIGDRGLGDDDVIVVDDVRFINEAEELGYGLDTWGRHNLGDVIKVVGRGTGSGQGEELSNIRARATIVNDGTVDELRSRVKEVLLEWGFSL